MKRPRAPLFLKRQSYRQRRLRDAARMLPALGLFLVLMPILWRPAETPRPDTAPDGLYLFGVWAFLILVAALMAPGLAAENDADEPEEG
jgi:hypothetical protein